MKVARHSQAISLVVALAFIVIITILAVGFAETVRIARPAAASYLERMRADQYAKSGVERVIATLNQQTGDTNRNWVSGPGQLITGAPTDSSSTTVDERKLLSTAYALHSGIASTSAPADKVLAPPNLNIATFRDPNSHLITEERDSSGNVLKMPSSWIYVRKSGVLDTNASPSVSVADPVIGRYAYWTDDESSKVNYNIAWGRSGNTNAGGHPTKVDLTALSGFTQSQANILHSFITGATPNFNFFNTPLDARRIEEVSGGAGVANTLKERKFDVTHFNSDPNTTFFNEPRIVLTTRPDRAGWTYKGGQWVGVNGLPWPNGRPLYLRILKNEGTSFNPDSIPAENSALDAGFYTNLDDAKLSDTLKSIVSYLKRKDWPMVDGDASLQDKYYSRYPVAMRDSRLTEFALNIVDYVRAKESRRLLIQPIRGGLNTTTQFFSLADASHDSYMGVSRTPYINEIGVWLGKATVAIPSGDTALAHDIAVGDIFYRIKFEVHLPKNYGVSQVDLANYSVLVGVTQMATPVAGGGRSVFKFRPSEVLAPSGGTILRAGEYATISIAQKTSYTDIAGSKRPTGILSIRLALEDKGRSGNLDIVPSSADGTAISTVPIDPEGVGENDITSVEVDDPRVNKSRLDWVKNSAGNTFGRVNNRYSVGKDPSTVLPLLSATEPQHDTDAGGKISDASFYMPPPAGTTFTRVDGSIDDNSKGQVASAGELGNLHTGVEPCSLITAGGPAVVVPVGGIPWRTLRLQPSDLPKTVVPDWAFLDLFTAPIAAPNQYNKYVYAPHDTSFGGRVNLNSNPEPFSFTRVSPLAAVMQGASYDSTDWSKTVSASDAVTKAQDVYNKVLATKGKQYGSAIAYDSPGEIVEMKGIADGGESSEELLRQTANLFTARGNVYTVYSIGQAIKQTPAGKLVVTGEQRMQAMVERYVDSTSVTRFSPTYVRTLAP